MGVTRSAARLGIVVAFMQTLFIFLVGFFCKYSDEKFDPNNYYPNFQDVHIMIFIGFGCLMSFLKRYSFSAIGISMLVAVISCQWTAVVRGSMHHDILGGEKIPMTVNTVLTNDFSAAAVLISMGVVLGKTGHTQLLIMAFFEVILMQINEYIGVDLLKVADIGESIFVHMFGAYFGLAVSFVLFNKNVENSLKEGSSYRSDVIAIIGSIFLWCFWPSFNGGGAGEFQERAYINTIFSLTACTAVTFALCCILNKEGKFDMVYIQNATLAGGVAVGTTANMALEPFGAMLSGVAAGIISVLGYKYLTPFLNKKRIHDTCGVHNLHGMPAFVAAIGSCICAAMSADWDPSVQNAIFPATVQEFDNATNEIIAGRSASRQAGYQFLSVVITLAFAIVGGAFVGLLMKLPVWGAPDGIDLFEDEPLWELPEDEGHHTTSNGNSYKIAADDNRDDTRM